MRLYPRKTKDKTEVYFNYTMLKVHNSNNVQQAYDYIKEKGGYGGKVWKTAPYGQFSTIHIYAFALTGKSYYMVSTALKHGTKVIAHLFGKRSEDGYYNDSITFELEPVCNLDADNTYVLQTEDVKYQKIINAFEHYDYMLDEDFQWLKDSQKTRIELKNYRARANHLTDALVFNRLNVIREYKSQVYAKKVHDLVLNRVTGMNTAEHIDKFKTLADKGRKWGLVPKGDLYLKTTGDSAAEYTKFEYMREKKNKFIYPGNDGVSYKHNNRKEFVLRYKVDKQYINKINTIADVNEVDALYANYKWYEEHAAELEDVADHDYVECPDCGHLQNKFADRCDFCYLEFNLDALAEFSQDINLTNEQRTRLVKFIGDDARSFKIESFGSILL